ncbi:hypothetical protein MIZ03_3854 [Rhodoferax lithotrophicus]|uniref:Uncharacterized protein n=1 Tax=Rhodoferax lithotrophicus TaxID=2798804 RepID=A0ABM7MRK9_9BURK|nr:hypothetical protein [Rhodoferax sp. MIZ03]BCO28944.1 hypothetical protein MIZ03_3854 [Rhodoferax sp. MIZ03]
MSSLSLKYGNHFTPLAVGTAWADPADDSRHARSSPDSVVARLHHADAEDSHVGQKVHLDFDHAI